MVIGNLYEKFSGLCRYTLRSRIMSAQLFFENICGNIKMYVLDCGFGMVRISYSGRAKYVIDAVLIRGLNF